MPEKKTVKKAETFSSSSDERIENNVMRHEYRTLNGKETDQMKRVKDLGVQFDCLMDLISGSREVSIAKTKMEEAVMWAVKGITR